MEKYFFTGENYLIYPNFKTISRISLDAGTHKKTPEVRNTDQKGDQYQNAG
jgi:hypothetical protein